MKLTLTPQRLTPILQGLDEANTAYQARYPVSRSGTQPVHTVYGGAHLFSYDSTAKLGRVALATVDRYAPDFVSFARAIGLPESDRIPDLPDRFAAAEAQVRDRAAADQGSPAWLASRVYSRMLEKLRHEPVEDFRLDFEDGYGIRPDEEEDREAERVAGEIARGLTEHTLPSSIGIRVKALGPESSRRGIRTLDIFMTALTERTGGALPSNFVVTLPKVTRPEQVAALASVFEALESDLSLTAGKLKMELMIETPQSILSESGAVHLPLLVAAAPDRVVAAHFGTYDYTAQCDIVAAYQHMRHPACDFARHMMQVALAGSGVWLSDGATNVLPVVPHRGGPGHALTPEQGQENRAVVHRAWRLHYEDVRDSLMRGFYQGWDLHPAQLPTRYAAVYAFFLENLPAASERLRNFIAKAAQATTVGAVFDDAATGQGLLNFFLRALNCGAITEEEAGELTGIRAEELHSRSFATIARNRREHE